jgi:hypothetical protein
MSPQVKKKIAEIRKLPLEERGRARLKLLDELGVK